MSYLAGRRTQTHAVITIPALSLYRGAQLTRRHSVECTYIQQRCSHGPWLARTSNKGVPMAHGLHVHPTKVFPWPMACTYLQQRCSHGPWLAVNKTILKPCLAAANGCANTHMWDFPDIIKFNIAVHTISEKAIRIGLKS